MDLDDAVSTSPKSGEPDMTTVAQCAELLNVDPAKLLSFALDPEQIEQVARAWDQGFTMGCAFQAGNDNAWHNPFAGKLGVKAGLA